MINRLGAPIEFDREHGGWTYTDKTWMLPGMIVTEGELLAFFLSMEISKRFLGSSLETPLRSAVEKITRSVKRSGERRCGGTAFSFHLFRSGAAGSQ